MRLLYALPLDMPNRLFIGISVLAFVLSALPLTAQEGEVPRDAAPQAGEAHPSTTQQYVIGPDDVLRILFWRDEAMSSEVRVRPDGRISIPLLNDIDAAGLTPEALRDRIVESAKRYLVEVPNVSVIVREINSRKTFITGQVTRPGAYPLSTPTNVLQLIALAGGLTEYADRQNITITRPVGDGTTKILRFNYDEVRQGRNTEQNIAMEIGDVVVVP